MREWAPGLVGFSCVTMQYTETVRIAKLLRAHARSDGFALPPVVVGVHPIVPEAVMRARALESRCAGPSA